MYLWMFNPSLCHLSPFHLVLCHCFKAMQERVASIYARTPLCTCTAEINYGKIIHFLFPEKAFLHHLIGMTGTFFILYLCLCVGISFTFYYSLILMVSLLFFP